MRKVNRVSEKSRLELLANLIPIQHFNTSDFPGDNVEYEDPFLGCQSHIPMTRAEPAFWIGSCVERSAKTIPAAASLHTLQSRHLCSQFGFALLDEKLSKFS